MEKEKWAYSIDGERFFPAYTRFEAVTAGEKEAKIENLERFYIGKTQHFDLKVDADSVIEQLQCEADDFAYEYASGYLEKCTDEQKQELEYGLTAVFKAWARKYNQEPDFFMVDSDDIEEISI